MFAALKKYQAIFSIASCLKSSLIPLLWLKLIDWIDLQCILFLQFTKMLRMRREAVWAGSKCLIYAEVPLNIYYLLSKVGEKRVNYMDVSDSRKGTDKYSSQRSVIFINPFLKKHTPSFFRLISNFMRSIFHDSWVNLLVPFQCLTLRKKFCKTIISYNL